MDYQQIFFLFLLFLLYPLSFISLYFWPWKESSDRNRNGKPRHAYNAAVGILLSYVAYGKLGIFHFALSATYTFILVKYISKHAKHFKNKDILPFAALFIVMTHLSVCHLHRMLWNGRNPIDLSGPMMIIAVKVTSIAWNIRDGLNSSAKSEKKFYSIEQEDVPSIVEFLGWFFFFPTFLTGPTIEYQDYKTWTDSHAHYHSESSKDHVCVALNIKDTFLPSMYRLAAGLVWAVVYLGLNNFINIEYLDTSEFTSKSFPFVFGYIFLALIQARSKFYFVWLVAEGACVAMGYGIRAVSKKDIEKVPYHKLLAVKKDEDLYLATDGMSNVRALHVELASSFGMVYRNWNIKTHHWLKQYVYLRLLESNIPILKNHATLWTYVTSAFWHGFYPGYYLMFIIGAFMTTCERTMRKRILPYIFKAGLEDTLMVQTVCVITTMFFTSYICIPFVTLGFWNTIGLYKALYFYGHIGLAAIEIAALNIPKLKLKHAE